MHHMRELLYQDRNVHWRLDLRQQRVYSVPRCSFCPPHEVLFFFDTAGNRSFLVPSNVDNQ